MRSLVSLDSATFYLIAAMCRDGLGRPGLNPSAVLIALAVSARGRHDSSRDGGSRSDIGSLVGMTAQVPARRGAGVGEQSVDAGFGLGRIEDELSFPILLQDSVVMVHDDGTVPVAVQCQTNVEDGEIHAKREYCCGQNAQKRGSENSLQPLPEIWDRGLIHEADL